jgi:hypothetical protein
MADQAALDSYLHSLDVERLQDVISSLEVYEDKYTPEHAVPGIIVLLNLLPELPRRQSGMFDFDARIVIGRVIYRLARVLKDPKAIEEAVQKILPQLTTLSAKEELISVIGYREGAGQKLVSESTANRFEQDWREEVRSASVDTLVEERELLRIMLRAKRDADPTETTIEIPDSYHMTLALLRSAYSEVQSQTLGSRAIRRSARLAWKI